MHAIDEKKQSSLFVFVWCIAAALMLGTCSYRFVSPTARDGRATFKHLSANDIRYISIEPAEYSSLVSQPVIIRDRQTITAFSKALKNLATHIPNHPKVTRAVVLRIQLKNKVLGGELRDSSNNGTTFYYMSNVNDGWVFATYHVPRNRGIFEIIEQVLASRPAPNNSFKPTPLRGAA